MPSNRYAREGSYVTGAVVNDTEGWLVLTMDELVQRKIANSAVFYFENQLLAPIRPAQFQTRFCARIGPARAELLVVGEYGECVVVARNGTVVPEQILVNGATPEDRGPLRSGMVAGDDVVIVGMDRQVYRRTAAGVWSTMEAGLPATPDGQVSGLEAVAGRGLNDLVAVGWDGEIWLFDGTQWRPVASPTNLVLTCVCMGADGVAYAAGRNGLMLRGTGDQWEAIDDTGCPDDLWDLACFRGELFAASLRRLYRWTGQQLERVVIDGMPESFAKFAREDDQALWSIGAKAVASYSSGGWNHIA